MIPFAVPYIVALATETNAVLHDYHTICRCVREGEDSFKRWGYHDPRGNPYRHRETALAWLRGVFRADHAHAGRTGQVLEFKEFMTDLIKELRLSSSSTEAFSGEY